MKNVYLEKIAITHLIGAYSGAKKGDKIGGTLIGGPLGVLAASPIIVPAVEALAKHNRPGAAAAAGLAGLGVAGYYGGKAYSAVKAKVLGDKKK